MSSGERSARACRPRRPAPAPRSGPRARPREPARPRRPARPGRARPRPPRSRWGGSAPRPSRPPRCAPAPAPPSGGSSPPAGARRSGADRVSDPSIAAPASPRTPWRPRARPPSRTPGPEISPCFCHFSSSLQPGSSTRMRLEALSASGPFFAIDSASSSAASSAAARLRDAVHQPQLGAALGGNRVAGEGQLHRHVVGDPARQAQQRAARRHQAALRPPGSRASRPWRPRSGRRPEPPRGRRPPRSPRSPRSPACSAARWAIPAKPRPSTYGLSPATNAFRSMPAQKPFPAPVRIADAELVVAVELVEPGGHAVGQRGVHRVAGVGPVEGDHEGAPAALGQHCLVVGHGGNLPSARGPSLARRAPDRRPLRGPLHGPPDRRPPRGAAAADAQVRRLGDGARRHRRLQAPELDDAAHRDRGGARPDRGAQARGRDARTGWRSTWPRCSPT